MVNEKEPMPNMSLDSYIQSLYNQALNRFNDNLEMHYIHAVSGLSKHGRQRDRVDKYVSSALVESFLKKRGYTLNYILKKPVMVKGFVVVSLNNIDNNGIVEVWHDIPKRQNTVLIKQSLLTGLPLTLDYMEKI